MKVKIGDTIYDSEEEPIMVILSPMDRLNIISMAPNSCLYLAIPKGLSVKDAKLLQQWVVEVPGFAVDDQSGGES